MNSPLERRKVRLRGLGGPAVFGVPCTGASATRLPDQIRKEHNSPLAIRKVRLRDACADSAAGRVRRPTYLRVRCLTNNAYVSRVDRPGCSATAATLLIQRAGATFALSHFRTFALSHSRTFALSHFRTLALSHFLSEAPLRTAAISVIRQDAHRAR
jgi:hypothetical protein